MKVVFTSRFAKDIKKLRDPDMRADILELVEKLPAVERLADIPDVKKLKGANDAFRIRIGEYRIGFFYRDDTLILARCADRKDLYRSFP